MGVYHEGELAIQSRAGVAEMAGRIGRGIRDTIPAAAARFLDERPFAVVGALDERGVVWASPLVGRVEAVDERTLEVDARPAAGDPLEGVWREGAEVGILAIDFATKRRMRLNGTVALDEGRVLVRPRQVYSNCPQYITPREVAGRAPGRTAPAARGAELTEEQMRRIAAADTFFVASAHPEAGADASHRGGPAGFVRAVDARTIVWPDFAGNTMFQTLGNIEATGRAALLFVDFETRATLQVTGAARVVWKGEERSVEVRIEETVEIPGDV
jgi:hypothetical protein